MELEQSGTLPFLDVLIKKNTDGTLAHTVYRKTTNTSLYLHVDLSVILHKQEQSCPLSSTVHELSVIKIVYRMKFITYSKSSETMAMLEQHSLCSTCQEQATDIL